MKYQRLFLFSGLLFLLFSALGCSKGSELREDVSGVADAMCKITEMKNKLLIADPNDSVAIAGLQAEELKAQANMEKVNQAFQAKYKDRFANEDFRKAYAVEFRKAILNCPYLSKEDRELFEREVE